MHPSPPVALTIAGSDCSAGAGIQADLKTFEHFRVHGLTAVTCVVSETANVVRAVHPVPPELVGDQVELLLDAFPISAIKTGMLFSAAHIEAVLDALSRYPAIPLVVDPVMIASTGDPLLEPDAIAALRDEVLPRATLVTPNLHEAEALAGEKITSVDDLERVALALSARFGTAFLLKGGHLDGPECTDLLADGGLVHRFTAARIAVPGSHGTGCTFSAAIAAQLALGQPLADAVSVAKVYLTETLAKSYTLHSPAGGSIHALNQGTTL
ncbi:bifunctional hydroxymethylpyrimidine kinase/phosphomethylpyrimidine kinase [Luteolibacter ambystomatis]|uniref:hydroxymethylpyrimidine kinase n=1 Tax=Luteolibacter ambystomatis TaxID=2824561 RepID=A0A975G672_9BACT|nr:bifunctional hydroxymethylpyrimidine kinase/phosphomethylpyrimidine kinase [Luteolibacter ambystomatis]QUE49523.1 bifunctional hydroxymethylpyrimidine kinase/phosphomethylpyrimidine kinase [Luteolibacter ambystomatis]